LCGQIIRGSVIARPEAVLLGTDAEAMEYQATMIEFMAHVGKFHADYIGALAGTANTYHIHLVSKLAESTDEAFNHQREEARALVYWTLNGKLEFSQAVPVPKSAV
jgi:hypothetical protein